MGTIALGRDFALSEIHAALAALGQLALAIVGKSDWVGASWRPYLDLAAVVLPTIFALAAAIMTTLPLESRAAKIWWRIGLVTFGVLISIVTWKQQDFARKESAARTADYYKPAGLLVYGDGRLTFYNEGDSTLYLWGDQVERHGKNIENEPRLIPKGANYYLFTDRLVPPLLEEIGQDGQKTITFDLYFKNEQGIKYVSHFVLLIVVKDGKLGIHTQMLSFDPEPW
ncbi:MAG: hypothetical protein WBF58_09815 [Xanthobacteraceae bacterium]